MFSDMKRYCSINAGYCWSWFESLTWGQKGFLFFLMVLILFIFFRICYYLTRNITF